MSEQKRSGNFSKRSSGSSSRPGSSRPGSSRPGSSRPGSSRNQNIRSASVTSSELEKSDQSSTEIRTSAPRSSSISNQDRNRRGSGMRGSDRKSNDRRGDDRRGSGKTPRSGERRSFNRDGAPRPMDENRRVRKFAEPAIPEEVTGKELDRKEAFALQSLALENAEMVAKHLVALGMFLESDPEKAYWHGQSAVFRAGRVAIVREEAGVAALRFGKYDVAIKELRAAQRISGSPSVIPYLAQCELALGDPRKTLEIAGSVDPKLLTPEQRVELRIAAAGARSALGQHDAAVVTLTCPELSQDDPQWSRKLRVAYHDALVAAQRNLEAQAFKQKYPQAFVE